MLTIFTAFWCAAVFAQAWAAYRTYRTGASESLPWFFRWLLASSVRDIILLLVGHAHPDYRLIWAWTEPSLLALMVAAVGEAHMRSSSFSRDKRAFPMIALGLIALVAAGATVASIGLDQFHLHAMDVIAWAFLSQRLVPTWAFVFLLLSALLYHESAVPISRPLRVHRNILVVFSAVTGMGYLIMHVTRGCWIPQVSLVLMGTYALLMAAWSAVGPIDLELPLFSEEARRYLRKELQSGDDTLKRAARRVSVG